MAKRISKIDGQVEYIPGYEARTSTIIANVEYSPVIYMKITGQILLMVEYQTRPPRKFGPAAQSM